MRHSADILPYRVPEDEPRKNENFSK